MISHEVRCAARLSKVMLAMNAANRWTPVDHPALTRREIAESMAALIAYASRVFYEVQFGIGRDNAHRYLESHAWAELKLRELRAWCDDE